VLVAGRLKRDLVEFLCGLDFRCFAGVRWLASCGGPQVPTFVQRQGTDTAPHPHHTDTALCPPKAFTFLFLNNSCQKLTDFTNFWYAKYWEISHEIHLTDLSASSVRCDHFTLGNTKKSFFNIIIHILQIIYVISEEKDSNCCTAALAVYLLLFNASYYLH